MALVQKSICVQEGHFEHILKMLHFDPFEVDRKTGEKKGKDQIQIHCKWVKIH